MNTPSIVADKRNTPSISDILHHWRNQDPPDLRVRLLDLGEPNCWGCGLPSRTAYSYFPRGTDAATGRLNPPLTRAECVYAWKRARLQRCHLVPRSLGGSDDPSNVVMLCVECHDLAPDLANRETMLDWMAKQDWLTRSSAKFKAAWESIIGQDTCDVGQFGADYSSDAFWEWNQDRIGIHFSQRFGGPEFSLTTVLGAWKEYRSSDKYQAGVSP